MDSDSLSIFETAPVLDRYLLLQDNTCCGVFKQSANANTFIVLSASGQFIQIYHNGNYYKHVTRFVPIKFQEIVTQLLRFRNQYSTHPYFYSRFSRAYEIAQQIKRNKSMTLLIESNHLSIYLCPLRQRVHSVKKHYIIDEDNCIEQPLSAGGIGTTSVYEVIQSYPIRRLPAELQKLMIQLAIRASRNGIISMEDSPVKVEQNRRDSAAQVLRLIDDLMECMPDIGADKDRYLSPISTPTSPCKKVFSTLTNAEFVDGDTFLISHDGRPALTEWEETHRTQLKAAMKFLTQHVTIAQNHKQNQNRGNNSQGVSGDTRIACDGCGASVEWESTEVEVEAWIKRDDETELLGEEFILRLKGDFFVFIFETVEGIQQETLHWTFLPLELEQRAQICDVDENGSVVWLDEHSTEIRKQEQRQANKADGTDISIGLCLLSHYYRQAMRLMWYRDHVIEQGKEAASPFSENATTTSSTTISESTISCSSVTRELPDGSKMTAILKPCRSHSEAAPYLLSLAQVPLDPNVNNDMCSLLTDVRAYPCDCVTHIHSAFADRTIIKFDLQSQMFSAMFPCGRECNFSLGSFKREEGIFATVVRIPHSNPSTDSDSPKRTAVRVFNGVKYKPPGPGELDIDQLVQYVHRVLAFHRWADTPAHLRKALEESDHRNAVIARSAALRSHHLLMTERIAAGELSVAEAHEQTAEFVQRLDASYITNPLPTEPRPHLIPDSGPRPHIGPLNYAPPPYGRQRSAGSMYSPFAHLRSSSHAFSVGSNKSAVSTSQSAVTAAADSSLSYSAISSSNPSLSLNQASRINVISPEYSVASGEDEINAMADHLAGEYVYQNVRSDSVHNSFCASNIQNLSHLITPTIGVSNEPFNINKMIIPKNIDGLEPQVIPPINLTTRKYLAHTYLNDTLSRGQKILEENKDLWEKHKEREEAQQKQQQEHIVVPEHRNVVI